MTSTTEQVELGELSDHRRWAIWRMNIGIIHIPMAAIFKPGTTDNDIHQVIQACSFKYGTLEHTECTSAKILRYFSISALLATIGTCLMMVVSTLFWFIMGGGAILVLSLIITAIHKQYASDRNFADIHLQQVSSIEYKLFPEDTIYALVHGVDMTDMIEEVEISSEKVRNHFHYLSMTIAKALETGVKPEIINKALVQLRKDPTNEELEEATRIVIKQLQSIHQDEIYREFLTKQHELHSSIMKDALS